ncbi:MAG: hypothetical protein D6785_11115, partial [Planctomycetota bacterium]
LLGNPEKGNPKELLKLEEKLFWENWKTTFPQLLDYFQKKNPKIASLLSQKKLSPSFIQNHLKSKLKDVLQDLLQHEITSGTLKSEEIGKIPYSLRASFDRGGRLASVPNTILPLATNGFEPEVRAGYSEEVKKLDPSAPHTLGTENYIATRFTSSALERIRETGAKVEIHSGGDAETFQSLKNRGYEVISEVRSRGSRYERMYIARHPKTGEIRYAITGLSGADRIYHMEAMLRMARIKSDQVMVFGNPKVMKERNCRKLKEGLMGTSLPGEKALIGFRVKMGRELFERALASRKHRYLKETFGENPRLGLIKAMEKEKESVKKKKKKKQIEEAIKALQNRKKIDSLFEVSSDEVFKRSAWVEKMKVLEG